MATRKQGESCNTCLFRCFRGTPMSKCRWGSGEDCTWCGAYTHDPIAAKAYDNIDKIIKDFQRQISEALKSSSPPPPTLDERVEAIERHLVMKHQSTIRDQCSNCKTGTRKEYCKHRPDRFHGSMQNCAHHEIKQECDGSGWLNRGSLKTRLCSGCDNCGHGKRRSE